MTDAIEPTAASWTRPIGGRGRPSLPPTSNPDDLAALHQRSIFVVDDDPIAIKLACQILRDYANVRFATSGEEALRLMHDNPPDLILLDGEMPGQSGFEVCKILKATPALHAIPVIFVTAHDDIAFETLALTLGAADFISKPLHPATLTLRVRLHLRLQHQLETLRAMALTDGLTGLANRRHFDDVLTSEWLRTRRIALPLSLLLLDIDYFKLFNDAYGHPAGDQCLREVARVVRGAAGRPHDLSARFGGEEFALILPHTDEAGALIVARRVHEALAEAAIPHRGSLVESHVTVSLGVACESPARSRDGVSATLDDHATGGEIRLVDAADRALYRAKRGGRNRTELDALAADLTP